MRSPQQPKRVPRATRRRPLTSIPRSLSKRLTAPTPLPGLADLLFEGGDTETARAVLAQLPADKQDGPAVAAVRAKIKLAEEAAALGNPAEFEARLAKNPNDHEARFDLAVIQNGQGKRAEAADNLLAIFKADRTWRDDAARQQLLQFFDAWGATDAATLSSRRKLSSILFS